ncbi:hypothetical protein TWF506_001523 [Arthrobotrys conoides]|uniref:Uncharacterized protein n=1 Tax=Arthrobotrys conoides TaxID=74498 RepID=A0AAN8NTA1_9PEZI
MRGPCILGRMTRLTGALSCLMPGVLFYIPRAGWLTGAWYGSWSCREGSMSRRDQTGPGGGRAGAKLVQVPLIVPYGHPDLLNPGSIPSWDRSDGFDSNLIVDC